VLDPDDPVTLRRLSDLQRAQPTDETLKALIGTLSTKLELCGRLPFLAYQADQEGFTDVAAAFRNLAVAERRLLEELLGSLRDHLDHTAPHAVSSETAS
jgi:rubrerythrin